SARKKNEKALEIKVQDQGRGMDDNTFAKAFVPLFSTKGIVGAGLGLSLAQAAIRRNSGEIDLKSAPGCGTSVTVTWPLSQPD
ncbi:MAG: ATP-binding protein, partial [Pseudomonadota bacterium]